ncbi:uncharacterized protein F4807DRAFT_408687 [Annulohypoxylon truncatum]|uniref:uncharacterized protein n=1 Tax=Annulohypoxylon truncatum TaxID=327061 RepID=UPI002008A140|nr:uncharacterized protein F4807DRAFT_408687 [Annulohypoxylon truncatum]KAI1213691.1 hypothetical protein F4807DRAFT_408687 [Annulohypoxylon truncatum]
MGIKGIYKEIGTGKRISLTKLAVEKLEETGRPFRLAIDISIWQFQAQAARGGSNPAIRTLFYRLVRLLGLSIQPIFVFDGPNKPAFKRNKRSGRGDGVATSMAKRMIKLFGFKIHDAPGEAEAECALLQQTGIVDAVLSEDVDTIMFGCTRTLRNWSSEGTKGSKTPTHVSMYDTEGLQKSGAGLDREGMVLVALMSGGDYLPEGIPGAGVKLACEAARAGFGKSLCRLKKSDASEIASWKEWLTFELRYNESGFFRTRHKALSVPESFPNFDILGYYTHPVVSRASTLDRLKGESWDHPVDIQGLREFVRETFDWNYRIGAIKFIRVLAPSLLVRKMMSRNTQGGNGTKPIEILEKEESELVRSITSKRAHFSTDATPELRISFIPTKIVGYDFQEEPDEVIEYGRDGLALNSDDEFDAMAEEEGADAIAKSSSKKPFNPTEPDLSWIPETIGKLSIPITVEDWEEAQRAKVAKAAARQKLKTTKPKGKSAGTTASLDKFVKVTKNIPQGEETNKTIAPTFLGPPSPVRAGNSRGTSAVPSQILAPLLSSSQTSQNARPTRSSKQSKSKSKPRNASPASRPDPSINPWTIAGSQTSPRVAKTKSTKASEPITISSSPPTSPTAGHNSSMRRPGNPPAEETPPAAVLPSLPRPHSSVTPTRTPQTSSRLLGRRTAVRALSPSPMSSEKKPVRKLARTETLPVTRSPTESRGSERQLARARTVAVEAVQILDSEDDDDFDLPPLSSILGPLPTRSGRNPFNCPTVAEEQTPPRPTKQKQQPGKQETKQATLNNTFNATKRTTKLYMPRKSEPGFFRELEVDVDEANELLTKARGLDGAEANGGRGAAWRRSDLSCIDLTGED